MTTSKVALCIRVFVLLVSATLPAWANGPLASGQLEIQGTRLTIYDDGTANDADQVLDVGQQARVRTCYGSLTGGCGTTDPSDPRITGLSVIGELRGPELPLAIQLRTYPGGAFEIPGFQQEGDYFLDNIRLVNDSTGAILGSADPSVGILRVRRIALASATVTTLSLEDLAARGISISQENFQAFNFTVGFYFGEEFVSIDLPVIYQGNGFVDPLTQASVNLDGLPPEVAQAVSRWQPPSIVPFTLEVPEQDILDASEEPYEPITFPIFGAIVLPGNVSFLNQFFDARLIIANGAPVGSGVDLANLTATIQLPAGNVLRLAATEPPVSPGQGVPLLTESGNHIAAPDEGASASWTIEGLATGTHVLRMDATGEVLRPGRRNTPVQTSTQAAVEVVDARFHLTFSHPDVVREGTEYSLFVTVANLSQATQNLISVEIDEQHITGAHKLDPGDDFIRSIETLAPGQSETIEFRLVADVTGKVLGGSFEAESNSGGGSIQLYTGVGELGIPLSPATLRLPRFSERLAQPCVDSNVYFSAAMRFLGLAYSLAVAPAGMAPQGLPHVIRSDVEARAVDMGFAGQRTFLDEGTLETFEVLLLDWLGNREPLMEIDELRRGTEKGVAVGDALAELIRDEQTQEDLGAVEFFDHFAETTSYARKYVAAMLIPGFAAEPPQLEILRNVDNEWTRLSGFVGDPETLRTLPYGDVIPISEIAGGTERVPLAVIGHVETDELFEVFLRNHTENETAGRLLLIVPDGDTGDYRRLDFGTVTVPAHSVYAVTIGAGVVDPTDGGFELINTTTTAPVAGVDVSKTQVTLPPFRLIGAKQDYGIGKNAGANRYGQGLSYLFNRPPDETTGTDATNFVIRSDFDGLNVRSEPVAQVSNKVGLQAFLQPSERVVNVRYSSPLCALVDPGTGDPLLDHQHLIDPSTIHDARGNALDPAIPEPQIETDPFHQGGLVGGKVLRGTGEPVDGAVVRLLRPRFEDTAVGFETVLDIVGEVTTGGDGAYYFDFVETGHADGNVQPQFSLRATVPEGADPATEPAGVEEITSTIRQENRLAEINIAMLGRGTVTGRLIYLDTGDPVAEGHVTVSSTLFQDTKTVDVEADGSFEAIAMPVGPLTLTGRDTAGRTVYATIGLERPGAIVDVVLELPRTQPPGLGTVVGTVYRQAAGDPLPPAEPAAGATVEVYSAGASLGRIETDGSGQFRFTDIPEGQIAVQAADFIVSRTAVVANVMLSANETVQVALTIPESETRSVSGKVLFYDPVANDYVPVANQPAFISGPGVFATTNELGEYLIEGVPVQAAGSSAYQVSAIDYVRKLQGSVDLPPIFDTSPDFVVAQDIVLREMRGGIRGVVLDPLGRPTGGIDVVAALQGVPYFEVGTAGDGSFLFDDVPLGDWTLTAHFDDGLAPGRIGHIGTAETRVIFGGHTPFVSIGLVGSGVVNIRVRTDAGSGTQSELYYRPDYYSDAAKSIVRKGVAIETQTDPNGEFQLELPVGGFDITAFSPFHGVRSTGGTVEWAGQVKTVELVFGTASTVAGTLVNVDGVTPIPDFEVVLETATLLPQTQITDAQGRFRFEMVPEGGVQVTAEGDVGSAHRAGIANGRITGGGQTLDLTVAMKAQGTVEGGVYERVGDDLVSIPYAQYYLRENSFPNRRLPPGNGWYSTNADGRYQVSNVHAGGLTIVARDPSQTSRQGTARGAIGSDWQVVQLPDIVMSTSVGTVELTIRDPQTGGVLPDTQVTLRRQGGFSEMTVADSEGLAVYEALPLGPYSAYAFHAPTGRSGVLHYLALNEAGQVFAADIWVDQRGEVAGTLYDDEAKLFPIPGGTVELRGQTAGGHLTALDTTSGLTETLGEFSFLGIPEGNFNLAAGIAGSNRRASGQVAVTATAPIGLTDLILEPAGAVAFRVFESLSTGLAEIDTSTVLLSARLQQGESYDYSLLQPTIGAPGHVYEFPDVLLERSGGLTAQELGGEQRRSVTLASHFLGGVPLPGTGTTADPYQIVLSPKGAVRVTVLGSGSQPVAGAAVTLVSSGGDSFPSVTDAAGQVTFSAVPAGNLTASATAPQTGFGGRATAALVYDDDVVEMVINLAPAVSAHGVIYQPVPGDLYTGDPDMLVPQVDAIVMITDSLGDLQTISTGSDGTYRFNVLPTGAYAVASQSFNGESIGAVSGTLVGPDGNDNEIPPIILDGGPPQIVSITPPPGMHDVSRTAVVEIVFSEHLLPAVLPTGQPTSPYFELRGPNGLAAGTWSWGYDGTGRPAVTFVPSTPYDNTSVYSLTINGGPSGIRDLSNRPLTPNGNVGSNFTTSDRIGPKILETDPSLSIPVDPEVDLRFDFNEALIATDEQLNGDGVDDAASFFWGQDDGAGGVTWQIFPVTLFLTRNDYSLDIDPADGLVLTNDTLARRVVIENLEDSQGNVMEPYNTEFRIRDADAPVIDDLPFPATAPTGDLVPGSEYVLTPVLSGIDHLPYDPAEGDIDRVDYFFTDPAAPGAPTQPDVSVSAQPFSFSFIASYVGNGVDPRPFPVWARAVDTSTNESNVALVELAVQPNQSPVIGSVDAAAVSPMAGVPYAGSTLQATIGGLDDPDGADLALRVELWTLAGSLIDGPVSLSLERPAGGWVALIPPTVEFTIPIDQPEGTEISVRAIAIDAHGASVSLDSASFAVADDQGQPIVESIVVRDEGSGQPGSLFHIGDELYIEVTVRDPETDVLGVEITLDRSDIFPSPQVATKVSGNLYRTATLSVPPDVFTESTPVQITAAADDRGGNTGTSTHTFDVAPEPDPTAPTVEWLTPWEGGAWPAGHTSVVSPGVGTAMLLRAQANDLSDDGSGGTVPGTIVSVTFAGPEDDGAGGITLSATPIPGYAIADTVEPGAAVYEAVWFVPDGVADGEEISFSVRVVDSGGLDVTSTVRLQARTSRKVYEAAQVAVLETDDMLAAGGSETGPVFVLDGAVLSLYPQSDGSVRSLASLYLYSGGHDDGGTVAVHTSRLTAPEVTSYGSPILYYPLELQIGAMLAVGHGAVIDASRRGLLGCTDSDALVLPGETRAGGRAGGSHGGSGWFGAPSSWSSTTTRYQPSSTFGSVRHPYLPGAGGGGWGTTPGGNGGGVVKIVADQATVRLAGDVRADGGGSTVGGGAGGAIEIVADRLEGAGAISARGGDSDDSDRSGGGGGGRIAITTRELGGGADPVMQTDVRGGGNGGEFLGGSGTVFLATIDSDDVGELRLVNAAGVPAAPTLLPALTEGAITSVNPIAKTIAIDTTTIRGSVVGEHVVVENESLDVVGIFPILAQTGVAGGIELVVDATTAELTAVETLATTESLGAHSRARYAYVALDGVVRAAFDGDVSVGAVGDPNPALNDPSSLTDLGGSARSILRDDTPSLSLTAAPDAGTDLSVGSSVSISWTASDPVGLSRTDESWPVAGYARVRRATSQPLSWAVDPDPLVLSVPADAAPGAATYTLVIEDIVGRTSTHELSWNILPNQLPTGVLAFADGAPTTVQAGFSTTVEVHAEDAEGVAAVTLTATGPAVSPTQTVSIGGNAVDVSFVVEVLDDADGLTPIVLQATITDISGAEVTTDTVQITVVPDTNLPVVAIDLTPAMPSDTYTAGDAVTIAITATDDVAVSGLSVTFDGETTATTGDPITLDWVAPPVDETTTYPLTAEATDPSGNTGTAGRIVTVEPLNNPDAPVVSIPCPLDGGLVAPDVPIAISVEVTDDDQIETVSLLVDGAPFGTPITVNATSFSGTLSWAPPAGALPGETFTVTVEARDYAANVGRRSVVLESVGGTVLSGDQLITSSHDGEDLVLASGTFTATQSLTPSSMTLLTGARLTTQTLQQLVVETAGEVDLACGSSIDASGRGYAGDATYPGETPPDHSSAAGSHLGEGGYNTTYPSAGSTYGSVTRPQENGAGGQGTSYGKRGGGAIRIDAESIDLQGSASITANGTSTSGNDRPGAGGSVWITATSITGAGTIRADGGAYSGTSAYGIGGDGGGGAVAIEYASIDQLILDGLSATSDPSDLWWGPGGAGTVFLKGPGATHGDLAVGNGDVYTPRLTVLPSLGSGAAQAGSAGVTLETGLGEAIPAFFVGHWVEIRQPDGTLKGTWRIESVAGTTATLETGATVAENDLWQGVYRFDSVTISDYGQVKSDDPIRTTDLTLSDGGRLEISEPIEAATLTMGGGTNSSIMWTPVTATTSVEILGPEKVYAQSITAPTLTIRTGSTLSQATVGESTTRPANLTIDVDTLVVEDGGAIDVTGRGYPGETTYPGATVPDHSSAAGSHLGEGGYNTTYPSAGSTYGSVTRPQENGAGGQGTSYGKRGGGAIRIDAASIDLQGSASITANGTTTYGNDHPGAGGSVWITATSITGTGAIRADGGAYNGTSQYGDGGGGAIAIEYTSIDQGILDGLSANSHASHLWWGPGGAGTVFLKGPGATHGDLAVGNGDVYTPRLTVLPSLGSGAAQAGSAGVTLETGLGEAIPAFFVGHWVEIRQPDGTLKGTWRIESVAGTTATLETGATVAENDLWQGVYRFDSVTISDYGQVKSDDPIRTTDLTLSDGGRLEISEPIEAATLTMGGGTNSSIMWTPVTATTSVEILGPEKVYAQSITAPTLTIRTGSTLSQATVGESTTRPANLTIDVDTLVVEDGGAIDVTGRGYPGETTYPGETPPDHSSAAGSHLGEGGYNTTYPSAGSTYGSVTRPQENGAGGQGTSYGKRGGGAIRIDAASIDLQGSASITANGTTTYGNDHPGAGGSVWITATSITGTGAIRADGGAYNGTSQYGDGGGGAIAIEYTSIDQGILDGLSASSHASHLWWGPGGAGTVFLKGPGATHGDLAVSNGDVYTPRLTVLPSLGSGAAQAGSAGVTLETGLGEAIPAFFVGHWVEIRQPDGTLEGTWRIESVAGTTATLETGATVAENDLWQGVYRFDSVTISDYGQVKSDDPIRTTDLTLSDGGRLEISEPIEAATLTMGGGTNSSIMWTPVTATTSVEILGPEKVYAQSITAPTLTIRTGSTLSQATVGESTTRPANLTIDVDTLVVEDGGAIDVTGRGYPGETTYPGETPPDHSSAAGSHLGEGGYNTTYPSAGSTYGSVTRPQENGAGGQGTSYGKRGGGAIRIDAASIDLQGSASITANGTTTYGNDHPGAGGSVWITATAITGTGAIRADGGAYNGTSQYGDGGGGAIAIEYTSIDQAILDGLSASSHASHMWWGPGGAGTVFLKGPGATHGDLIVANSDITTPRWTVLPTVGGGVAQAGSSGVVLETGLASTIPAYFVGHWVEIRQPDGTLKGTWRIEAIGGTTLTLETGATAVENDLWQGVYRFDSMLVTGNAQLRIDDLDEIGTVTVDPGATLVRANLSGPTVEPSLVLLEGRDGGFAVTGRPGAVTDPEGVVSASAVNVTAGGSWPLTVAGDGSFPMVSVTGSIGDLIRIDAADGHPANPRSSSVEIGALPANGGAPAIDVGLITYSPDGFSIHATGAAAAISDSSPPVAISIENTTAGGSWSTTAAADGSFDLVITASCGDVLTLTAVDSHPQPLQATADLGPMPDVVSPVINPGSIAIRAHDRAFWASGWTSAIDEACSVDSAYLTDPAQPGVQSPVTVQANGSFADAQVPSTTVGVIPQLTVVDGGGNSAVADLDPLPANDGAPRIETLHLSTTTPGGAYEIGSSGTCIELKQSPNCDFPFEDGDSVDVVRFENRTTPGFDPVLAAVVADSCYQCAGGSGYLIDPTIVAGAVGDEIWVVVEDGHPQWQSSEVRVWTLPGISGAPIVNTGLIDITYLGGQYRLNAAANAVTDADAPIALEAIVWRDNAGEWIEITRQTDSITSGAAFEMTLPGGVEGDLLVLSATDSNGATNNYRVGNLPAAVAITGELNVSDISVDEFAGVVSVPVYLSALPTLPVTIDYRTQATTASAGIDYVEATGTLDFNATAGSATIEVTINDDFDIESDETFQIILENPVGVDLGAITTTIVIIVDDDDQPRTVAYSVRVNDAEMLTGPIGVDIANGVATFDAALPAGPDRGDQVLLDDGSVLFISRWIDELHYDLVETNGLPAGSRSGRSVVSITPAFSTLDAAVDGAGDVNHLGSFDLVASHRTLEIVCYAGWGDEDPVTIDGWVTSPEHRIRIVAPTATGQRSGSQRHNGRQDGTGFVLYPWEGDCLTSTVGNLTIEGLRITGEADGLTPATAIRLVDIDGDVEIIETLIGFYAEEPAVDLTGITMTASVPSEVVVRNSIIWDLGDGSSSDRIGIEIGNSQISATIANTTIVGGTYGIRNNGGTATAINNLIAGAATACFDGAFTPESAANIATDATAPNPPSQGVSPVTVQGDLVGWSADLHLACNVLDQAVTVTSTPIDIGSIGDVFDGNSTTLARSAGVNPAWVQFEFDQPRTLTGSEVCVSHGTSHEWTLALADSVTDMESKSGSYRELVTDRSIYSATLPRVWGTTAFAAENASVARLTVKRLPGNPVDYVHICEWRLEGTNPACGAGVDLSSVTTHEFDIDVDGQIRVGAWDIGADQARGLTVGLTRNSHTVWESEGTIDLQVMLDAPATAPVSVRYRTTGGSASPVEDFIHTEGELVFALGEVSQVITVPLIDDGPGEGVQEFYVDLSDSAGAAIGEWRSSVWVHDDDAPLPRISLETDHIEIDEFTDTITIEAHLSSTSTNTVDFGWRIIESTATIGTDIASEGGSASIPPGSMTTTFDVTIIDDDISEIREEFTIAIDWHNNSTRGAPSSLVVSINDDDVPAASFVTDAITVDEAAGAVQISVHVPGELESPGSVDVVLSGGTATLGNDFIFSPQTLDFDAIHRTGTIDLEVLSDLEAEADEIIELQLSNGQGLAIGSPDQLIVTIEDLPPGSPVINSDGFSVDTSGCVPLLIAEVNSVTALAGPISVTSTVSHPSLPGFWESMPVIIDSGDGFTVDLDQVEPGSEIVVTAVDANLVSSQMLVVDVDSSPPVMDTNAIGLALRDGDRAELIVSLDHVSNALHPLNIVFSNLHPARTSTSNVGLGCHIGAYTIASVPAEIGDPLQFEICNGDLIRSCTDPIDLGGTPFAGLKRFELAEAVTGVTRHRNVALATTADGSARAFGFQGRWDPSTWGNWEGSLDWPVDWPPISGLATAKGWNVVVAAGDMLAAIDFNGPIFGDRLPIASGVPVDAWLHHGNHIVTAGRSAGLDAILMSISISEANNGTEMCSPVVAAELTGTSGLNVLAAVPLAPNHIGLVVDALVDIDGVLTPILPIDIADPEQPVRLGGTETTALAGLNAAPVSAALEDDHLVITTGDGRLFMYRFDPASGWLPRLELGAVDGGLPVYATRWGDSIFVGYSDGRVCRYVYAEALQTNPLLVGAMDHPGQPVVGMTSLEYSVMVAFPWGLETYNFSAFDVTPELHREAVRFDGGTLSVRPYGLESTDIGADLIFDGTGLDGGGQPAPATWTSAPVNFAGDYRLKIVVEPPLSIGDVTEIAWTDLTVTDRESGHSTSLSLETQVAAGPPFFDPDCRAGYHTCRITTGAAGPGWRASAGRDSSSPWHINYRYTLGSGWTQQGLDAQGAIHHLAGFGNLLLTAADTLMISDMTDLTLPQHAYVNPHSGSGIGPVTGVPGSDMVAAAARTGLVLAVIDVSIPDSPVIVTAAQTLDDGIGTIVDLHADERGYLWVLATNPDRLLRLDATSLPTIAVLEVHDLPGSAPVAAVDSGLFDSTLWGNDLATLFIVRSGYGIDILDAADASGEPLNQIELPGDPRDVFVADSISGLRILVASGLGKGVIEVGWDDVGGQWTSRWAADLGHVRAFAYAADSFRAGEMYPETCADIGHMDTKSTVPDTGTPQLYAVTDAGILHVDVDLREASAGTLVLKVLPAGFQYADQSCPPAMTVIPYAHRLSLDCVERSLALPFLDSGGGGQPITPPESEPNAETQPPTGFDQDFLGENR